MKTPRTKLAEYARRLAKLGLVTGTEGNLSLCEGEKIYTTPTGAFKGELRPEEIVVLDRDGRVLEGGRPSSEVLMHLAIYQARPEIRAVVHAHPPYTVALDLAGHDLSRPYLAEGVIFLKKIVRLPFLVPGTAELAKALCARLSEAEVFVLARHGAVTLGRDLSEALNRMCILEQVARITWLALVLTPEAAPLSEEDIQRLCSIQTGSCLEA